MSVPAHDHGHPVRVRGVTKRYGRTVALTGVELSVDPGQFLVLLGPSGSGKSTLIRSLAGVEHIDHGEIHLGRALVDDGRRRLPPERRDLAMVFQDYALWPHLTVVGNVRYALRRRKVAATESAQRCTEALDRVGLAALADRYPHELSGGEQQRVALARAVVSRPRLLLFDEPLSNLDADLRERLRVEIATLTRQSGATAVYITHDQAEAFALADVIGVLDKGGLIQIGAPETIYHDPATPFVARFTGLAGELAGATNRIDGDVVVANVGRARLRAKRCGPISAGDPVRLLVRPAAVHIAADGHGDALDGELSATVVDVAYRGRGYDHVLDCGQATLGAVFDSRAHPRGARVRITVDTAGCLAFPRTDRERTDG